MIKDLIIRTNGSILFTLPNLAAELSEFNSVISNSSARLVTSNATLSSGSIALDIFDSKPTGTAFIASSNEVLVDGPSGGHYVLAGKTGESILEGRTSVKVRRRWCDREIPYVGVSGGFSLFINKTFLQLASISAVKF
ncbi:hypothetical protein K431DRAFT_295159 [Polychaeton citri CBS 116435]|uniref:Uncharacterized protein n=1 Tax=Polychaeton citri CBS 116435 TaxID=1314669 RepID=A0A9P4Q4K8_9PEZI|nr:hypothetical protein K431DRAFT_295159 [Polychaeton citri CBS 116435]